MKNIYKVIGMTCQGCRSRVEESLNSLDEIASAKVILETSEAEVDSNIGIPLTALQAVLTNSGLSYTIMLPGKEADDMIRQLKKERERKKRENTSEGVFYCPMFCEAEKTYHRLIDCPVCGMDLVEKSVLQPDGEYACPSHPEVIQKDPGQCSICESELIFQIPQESSEDKAFKEILKKFNISLFFTIPIFIISMSEMIPGNPLPKILKPTTWNWLQLLLSLPVVFYTCSSFFIRAWKSVKTWNLNMFTLIGLGTGVAFLFSLTGLFFPSFFPEEFKKTDGSIHLYFESVVVILTLALLGQLMESKAHSRTRGAIKELLNLAPSEATLVSNGEEKKISVRNIKIGDWLRIKPGEKVPVDGTILEGSSNIDESMITGEPVPVEKAKGDKATSGTINGKGSFIMKTDAVGANTLLSRIIQMVDEASRSRSPMQNLADSIAKFFVPTVVSAATLTFFLWSVFGPEPAMVYGLVNAVAVLIIACPCALGLATPMSVMVGMGKGAGSGVLIKNAAALEKMRKVTLLVTDKTGTITEGRPTVNDLYVVDGKEESEIVGLIGSLSQSSEHPLAGAILEFTERKSIQLGEVTEFEVSAGIGASCLMNGKKVSLCNQKLIIEKSIEIPADILSKINLIQSQGKTLSYIVVDDTFYGFISFTDKIKADSISAITDLKKQGVKVVMLTGDNRQAAEYVSGKLGLDDVKAELLPEDKLNYIKEAQKNGEVVAMAGDGINDSPALAMADVGIAMGTGTDIAIESSEITLVKGDLRGILRARKLSYEVVKNIKQNLFFAFIYNTVGVPIAAGALFPFFGILLSPMIAALAMSFSSISVITNSLRLKNLSLDD